MEIRILHSEAELQAYDAWVKTHPHGSLWQSLEWKAYQEALGREVRMYAEFAQEQIIASALVTIDRGWKGLSTWEIGRGPLRADSGQQAAGSNLISSIMQDAKSAGTLCLYVSAPNAESQPASTCRLAAAICHLPTTHSPRHTYPEATRVLDVSQPEEALLAQMHQKGRYNIRLAEKNGVRVERSQDIDAYCSLACATAKRDGFLAPSKKQFQAFLDALPGSFLLLAYEGEKNDSRPIAGLLGVCWKGIGIYYYGASSYEHRALMAPYLLQWRAMQHCRAHGCLNYDLLGITPPAGQRAALRLSSGQASSGQGKDDAAICHLPARPHPWDGISSFKEKFGGTVVSYPPEQMAILRPWAYKALQWKRKVLG